MQGLNKAGLPGLAFGDSTLWPLSAHFQCLKCPDAAAGLLSPQEHPSASSTRHHHISRQWELSPRKSCIFIGASGEQIPFAAGATARRGGGNVASS